MTNRRSLSDSETWSITSQPIGPALIEHIDRLHEARVLVHAAWMAAARCDGDDRDAIEACLSTATEMLRHLADEISDLHAAIGGENDHCR